MMDADITLQDTHTRTHSKHSCAHARARTHTHTHTHTHLELLFHGYQVAAPLLQDKTGNPTKSQPDGAKAENLKPLRLSAPPPLSPPPTSWSSGTLPGEELSPPPQAPTGPSPGFVARNFCFQQPPPQHGLISPWSRSSLKGLWRPTTIPVPRRTPPFQAPCGAAAQEKWQGLGNALCPLHSEGNGQEFDLHVT
ncbi:hypothetical protein H1C71_033196 [Ictidomys tridecemlineatus]|nr:hypothetical protein H1C71_033196 [Ictidomys tridecemlineatus]